MKVIKITTILIITLFIISVLPACTTTQEETQDETHNQILLEYKPNDKIHLIVRGYNGNKDTSQSSKIITSDYNIYDFLTNTPIRYTDWIQLDFNPPREIKLKSNKLVLTNFIYAGTHPNEQEFPFLADEFYVENGKLWHASVIAFKPSAINKETLLSIKNKMLKYKHRDHTNVREDEMQDLEGMPDDLLILALCGDNESIQLLKDRGAYNKYFNIELDGAFGEIHSSVAGAYDTFEYLQHQGGSIKEVIPLDKPDTASSSVQY